MYEYVVHVMGELSAFICIDPNRDCAAGRQLFHPEMFDFCDCSITTARTRVVPAGRCSGDGRRVFVAETPTWLNVSQGLCESGVLCVSVCACVCVCVWIAIIFN